MSNKLKKIVDDVSFFLTERKRIDSQTVEDDRKVTYAITSIFPNKEIMLEIDNLLKMK